MPGTRHRQLPFFHRRWGGCQHCSHVDLYEVASKKGARLRDQACSMCHKSIGRNSGQRAKGARVMAAQVERLARRMRVGFSR